MQEDYTGTVQRDVREEEGYATHLPPRREYHKNKKKKQKRSRKKKKIQYPIMKLLVGIFLLLPIIIAAIIFYLQEISKDSPTILDQKEPVFDHVEFEDEK